MYKITNFIYQSKGSRNIYEKAMYHSMRKKKIWDKHSDYRSMEAKDVYISPFGKACQAYATMFFENWVILSAKHGFLRPSDIVLENYDLAFDSKAMR